MQPVSTSARGATLCLALCAAAAQGQVQIPTDFRSDLYVRDAIGTTTQLTDTTVGAISLAGSAGAAGLSSSHDGSAAALLQTLKAQAGLDALNAYGQAKITASFSKTVIIDAGSSGLSNGAPVTFSVPLKFDGNSQAGGGSAPGRSLSSADISLTYRVFDHDVIVCSEGCHFLQLMSFRFGSRAMSDTKFDESVSAGWNGWSISAYGAAPIQVSGGAVKYYSDVPDGFVSQAVNTGPLSFSIVSKIGNHLAIEASLDVFLQADAQNTSAFAAGDFKSTFDAGLVSDVAGVQLIGELPGVYGALPVPEPQTWALMLAGLGLLAVGRRHSTSA